MGAHLQHQMHANSLEAFRASQSSILTRSQLIVQWMTGRGPVTDRQVMTALGFSDPNKVRPRITELVDAGDLVECGKIVEDGRNVRLVKIAPRQMGLALS